MQLARPGKTMPGALKKKGGERERERKKERERERERRRKEREEKAKGEDSSVTQHN